MRPIDLRSTEAKPVPLVKSQPGEYFHFCSYGQIRACIMMQQVHGKHTVSESVIIAPPKNVICYFGDELF